LPEFAQRILVDVDDCHRRPRLLARLVATCAARRRARLRLADVRAGELTRGFRIQRLPARTEVPPGGVSLWKLLAFPCF
jgi:hypothetical protein